MEAREVLEKVKNNEISIEEAEKYFKKEPFEEMGYAKLDTHREIRSGFAEVIFCARKADEHLLKIFTRLYEQELRIFPLPRRRRRPQNTSVQTLSVSTMSV